MAFQPPPPIADEEREFTARATGYYPVDPGHPEYRMQGGRVGAGEWHGKRLPRQEPLFTLEQYQRGEAPYVSTAMDNTANNPLPYGTFLQSPDFPGVPFRVMDTGSAFNGRTRKFGPAKGLSRIDIAREARSGAYSRENNRDVRFSVFTPPPPIPDDDALPIGSQQSSVGFVPPPAIPDEDRQSDTPAVDPALQTELNRANEQAAIEAAGSSSEFMRTLDNAVRRGWAQSKAATAVERQDADGLAATQREVAAAPPSEAMRRFTESKDLRSAWNSFAESFPTVLPELVAESLAAFVPTWFRHAAVQVPAGVVAGGAAGAPAAGVGAVPGALIGARVGFATSNATASYAIESAGKIIEVLRERGINVTDPESLRQAFADKELMDDARTAGMRKGIPIALFDGVSAGIAGRLMRPGAKLGEKLLRGSGEMAIQSGLGAAGEAAGQTVAGEERDWSAILAEAVAEIPTGAVEIAAGTALDRAAATSRRVEPTTIKSFADLPALDTAPESGTQPASPPTGTAAAEPAWMDDPRIPHMVKLRARETLRTSGLADEEIDALSPSEVSTRLAEARNRTAASASVANAEPAAAPPPTPDPAPVADDEMQSSTPARELTPEELAEAEYRAELRREADEAQSEHGREILDAVIRAGGLPSRHASARAMFSGEVARVEEAARDPQRVGERIPLNQLFRQDAPSLDDLATALRDEGFDIQTPDDLLGLLENRIRSGRKLYGLPERWTELASPTPGTSTIQDRDYIGAEAGQIFQRAASPRTAAAPRPPAVSPIGELTRRFIERSRNLRSNRQSLAAEVRATAEEKKLRAAGVTSEVAQSYARQLIEDYASAIERGEAVPERPRLPIYRPDYLRNATAYDNAARYGLAAVRRAIADLGIVPKQDIYATIQPPVTGNELGAGPAAPADNRDFTAFPVDLPEAVRFSQELLGTAIRVKKRLRALRGAAAGVFRHTDGPAGKGEIILRADIADLLTSADKARLMNEAQAYAAAASDNPKEQAEIAQQRYEFLLDQAYEEAKTRPPVTALKVIWHEIGHAVDWLPEKMIAGRGNLFGHIAALKRHLRHVIALDPAKPAGKLPSEKHRKTLLDEAERQLRREMGPIAEIVETVMVEEPILRIEGITPADVRKLFGIDGRESLPELYKWFAEQPANVKKEIVRKAMHDVLDERLAKLGKTEQVGTRTVKRTVRKKIGRPPTADEIAARFRQLLRAEIERRNIAELKTVKAELSSAIAWWHGTDTMPAYFATPEEMFAEAFSIFMNNPAALQKRAPTFARLLWNYLDARPEVASLYERIQNQIKAAHAEDATEQAMLDSWDAVDAREIEEARRPRETLRDLLDNVSYHVDRRMGPIYRAAKGTPAETRVRDAIGNFLYRAAEHELLLNRMNQRVGEPLVRANLDWKDLGRYMFYSRVLHERFKTFNPYGIAPDRAAKRLDAMRQRLGPQRWTTLEQAHQAYRQLREEIVIPAMRGMWSPELQAAIESNVYYATFDVQRDAHGDADGIARLLRGTFGSSVGPHIYRQIGTVREIKNPATATVLKDLSLLSAAARNTAKRETVQMLLQNDRANIIEAEKRFTGKRWEHVVRDTAEVGTVVYLQDGAPHAFYVRKVVADALNKGNAIENRLVLAGVRATSGIKAAFTQLNYAFWPVNFVRDTLGWILQMPGATPKAWFESAAGALRDARSLTKGKRNPHAERALERRMLISRADPHGIWSAADNEFEVKLASYGLNPAMWRKEHDRVHALVKLWNSYRELGQSFERVNKLAGMNYLDRHFPNMPEWKKREIVRERAGSPDFLQRGTSNPYIDFVMMFYNPWKEGLRSLVKSARENPWSFGAKASALIVTPTVLQAVAASGGFGDETRRQFRSIPDYDLSNYLCIPFGWQDREQAKVAYLRLPLWEPARMLHGTLWQFITGRGEGLTSFWGGQVPSMNSLLQVAYMWASYEIFGHNPYDTFRGRTMLSDTEYAAGGWHARQRLIKHTWNSLGGSIAHRFQNPQLESPPEGEVEKFLRLPVVSNALGRWVKVSNRGLTDADRMLTAPVQQQRAETRLAVQEITRKLLAAEPLADSEKRLLRDPYAVEYLFRTLPAVSEARRSNLTRRLQGRPLNERAMILQAESSR
jgi:hypothetical protein